MRSSLYLPLLFLALVAFSSAAEQFRERFRFPPITSDQVVVAKRDVKKQDFPFDFGGFLGKVVDKVKEKVDEVVDKFKNRFAEERQRVGAKLRKLGEAHMRRMKLTKLNKEDVNRMLEKGSRWFRQRLRPSGDNIEEVNEKVIEEEGLFEGDILLTEDQVDDLLARNNVTNEEEGKRNKRQAMTRRYNMWQKLYYSFDAKLPASTRSAFRKAVQFWQENTCLDFEENDNPGAPRVHVVKGSGCSSYIGRIYSGDKVQQLSLGEGCDTVGIAQHELAHAMGFFHEQSRHDRDAYLTLSLQNAQQAALYNFDKQTPELNDNFGMPYDYGSVMHYGSTFFSANGNPTMNAKDAVYQRTMGSQIPSHRDVWSMNTRYNCQARCPSNSCQNGGFPNSRDCSRCICPPGYSGDKCGTVGSWGNACSMLKFYDVSNPTVRLSGSDVWNGSQPRHLRVEFGDGIYSAREEFLNCAFPFHTAANLRVRMKLTDFKLNAWGAGCPYGGAEFKLKKDTRLTGTRSCHPDDVGLSVVSEQEYILLLVHSKYGMQRFDIYVDTVPAPSG